MSRGPNTIRQCPSCQQIGRQTLQTAYSFHTVRRVECRNARCGQVKHTLELYLGFRIGRGRKVGQAQALLDVLMASDDRTAIEHIKSINARYLELTNTGAVLTTNSVRTCPLCAEPGQALYASNHGPHVMHCYQCTDKECAQRWLSAEFALAKADSANSMRSFEHCVPLLREAVNALQIARASRRRELRVVTQSVRRERAELIREITISREISRLTDEQVLATCRELIASGLRPTLEMLRSELAKRYSGRVGWRRQVMPLWQQALAEAGLADET